MNWNGTPFVKSWLKGDHRLRIDLRFQKQSTKAFCKIQLAT